MSPGKRKTKDKSKEEYMKAQRFVKQPVFKVKKGAENEKWKDVNFEQ